MEMGYPSNTLLLTGENTETRVSLVPQVVSISKYNKKLLVGANCHQRVKFILNRVALMIALVSYDVFKSH